MIKVFLVVVFLGSEGIYMARRRFRIPRNEIERYYYRKDLTVNDFILPCDYEELLDEDSEGWVLGC